MKRSASGNRSHRSRRSESLAVLAAFAAAAALGFGLGPLGGCTNDPFDPSTLANSPPTVRLFVEPLSDGELNPTSYYNRTFHWSGSDRDGFVTEYYVSIRTQADVPAPWDTTTRTDTTMTFTTDDEGRAEATFLLACRDDRGALSDTVAQYVPLQNFPPALNFQSDFEPLRNLQREIVYEGEAAVDTVYWNYGANNFRLFAFDLDGNETMNDHYLYTLAQPEPEVVRDHDDPLADPEVCWIRTPFLEGGDVLFFEILVGGLAPGERTLTVKISDEAAAETRFTYSWLVRQPRGDVLLVPDSTPAATDELFTTFMNVYFGPDAWDSYEFRFGFPDNPWVLLATLRRFSAAIWYDGGATSQIFREAAARYGPLQEYVEPTDGSEPGQLMVVSKAVCGGDSDLPNPFIQQVLGISPTGAPQTVLEFEPGHVALGEQAHLPALTAASSYGRGIGMTPLAGTEVLYRMEECVRCYGRRPPWDPVVAVRRPERTVAAQAAVVVVSLQLEHWEITEVIPALSALLAEELGVSQP